MHPRTALLAALLVIPAFAAESLVYIGTYTRRASKGIYAFRLDSKSGKMTPIGLVAESVNPSFLAIHPSGKYLYAVNEIGDFGGAKSGSVTSFSIDQKTGKLTQLNAVTTKGDSPCHVTVDPTGQTLLVANYGGGSVASYGIAADGRISEPVSFIQHTGSSVDPRRQKGPHAHSINPDPSGKYAVVADLGLDKVFFYPLDRAQHRLDAQPQRTIAIDPGSGPRHVAFHPKAKTGYVINEMLLTLSAFSLDPKTPRVLASVSTLPQGVNRIPEYSTAEVRVHPSGKYVYGSNRGHDTIATFAADSKGMLKPVGHTGVQGKTPRNFNLDPSGKFMLVANQDSDNVVLFRIGPNGVPQPTGQSFDVGAPVCVRFLPLKK